MARKESKLKIIPLGGLNEIGKNMTAYEYGNEILVVDCGMSFPEEEMLGIDIVLPDITYLKKNIDKVRGIVITHGHEDHIGAIPYVLQHINVPIYATKLTVGLINNKLKEHKNVKKKKIHVHKAGDVIKVGRFSVEMIKVNHSIPDAVALCIETPVGKIVHTGDFKVDYTPIDGEMIDLGRFAELGNEGVLALLADSTNVLREGYTMSERNVAETFDDIFGYAKSRIIIASFASNVDRVQMIVNAAELHGRKVAFAGRSMENVSTVARELGYLKVPDGMIIDIRDTDRYPENEVCIVTTGSQGEPMAALTRMATDAHRNAEIIPGDLVIFSSSPIPGNEKSVFKTINLLYEKGANVIYEKLADVHVSGHACKGELRLLHSLVKPKYFIPVHGEYGMLTHHAMLAEELGMSRNNVFILENGLPIELGKNSAKVGKPVPSGAVFVDGLGVGDVGNIVLRDRKRLSEDGLIIVMIALKKSTGEIVSGPDIVSRGFVYVRESEALMGGAKDVVNKSLSKLKDKEVRDWAGMKNAIKDDLKGYLYANTRRSPMILPIIMEV